MTNKEKQKYIVYFYAKAIFNTPNNQKEQEIFLAEIRKKGFTNWNWFKLAEKIETWHKENQIFVHDLLQNCIDAMTEKQTDQFIKKY